MDGAAGYSETNCGIDLASNHYDENMSEDGNGSLGYAEGQDDESYNSEEDGEDEEDGNIRNCLPEAVRVLKEEDLAICTSRVQGFALDSKRWSMWPPNK